MPHGDGDIRIKSGDTFALTTFNPITHPLPSFELLEMQWHLNRIVSMSGAADIYDDDDDDDDHHSDGVVYKSPDIVSWVSSLSSFHASEDDDGRLDHTMTTVSSYPSTRGVQANLPSVETRNLNLSYQPISLKTRESQGVVPSVEAQNLES